MLSLNVITAANSPAAISSAIMPYPPGSFSNLRMPKGFMMSKARNSTKLTAISHQGLTCGPAHNGSIAIHCPTVSSAQAATGSLPQYFSDTLLAHVPAIVSAIVAAKVTPKHTANGVHKYNGNHNTIANNAPHVPGIHGRKPTIHDVAISLGSNGNFSSVIGIGLRDFMAYGECLFEELLDTSYDSTSYLYRGLFSARGE